MTEHEIPLTRTAIGVAVAAVLFAAFGCTTTEPPAEKQPAQPEQERTVRPEIEEAAKDAEKKTIEALKAVQLACEAYAVDWGVYPSAGSMTELRPIVTPAYMYDHDLPDLDGFGNTLAILSRPDGYLIGSAGPDGIGNTDDDLCLREDLRLTRESCGLEYPGGEGASRP